MLEQVVDAAIQALPAASALLDTSLAYAGGLMDRLEGVWKYFMSDPVYVGLAPVRHYIGGLLFRNAAAKLYEKATGRKTDAVSHPLAIAALALLPDADVALGIEHRGPTHSLAFAATTGLMVGAGATAAKKSGLLYGALAAAAVASHVAVDLLVEGGTPLNPTWPAGQDIHVHDRDYPGHVWTALGTTYMWFYYGWGARLAKLKDKVTGWFRKKDDTPCNPNPS